MSAFSRLELPDSLWLNYQNYLVLVLQGSQWDQCSTTPIKVESYSEITLTSAGTTLLLVCVQANFSRFTVISVATRKTSIIFT